MLLFKRVLIAAGLVAAFGGAGFGIYFLASGVPAPSFRFTTPGESSFPG